MQPNEYFMRVDLTQNIVLFNSIITWHSSTCCIKSQRVHFGVQEQRTKFLSGKILVNIDAERHFDHFFPICIYGFSNAIVLGFEFWTVKSAIVSFVVIIEIAIVIGFVLVRGLLL